MKTPQDDHYLQRELYQRMQSSRALFDFLQEGSLDGIWYWDLEEPKHEWMSPKFWQALGYDPSQKKHLASEWQDLIHPEDREAALRLFTRHCEDPEVPYDLAVRYKHRDGSTVWVRCRGMVIRDDAGKPIRMLGAHTNITPYKEAGLELAEQNELLEAYERSNEELRQFAYVASHDLQEPLRMVRSFCKLLQQKHEGQLDEESQLWFGFVLDGAERMQALIRDLLEYSKLDGKRMRHECVDSRTLLDGVLLPFKTPHASHHIHLDSEVFPLLRGDKQKLSIVFQNLISNGLKFNTSSQPQLWISFQQHTEGMWRCSVRDDGVGIPKKHQQKVFDLFRRLVGKDEFPGTGLGLAICKKVIYQHGGEIWIESDPSEGPGTTLHFTLPEWSDHA